MQVLGETEGVYEVDKGGGIRHMANWYSDWQCDTDIVCPYCGEIYKPTYEETYIGGEAVDCYKEGEQGEFTCDDCGKRFTLSAEVTWLYTTETIDGECTEDEYYERFSGR